MKVAYVFTTAPATRLERGCLRWPKNKAFS